MEPKAVAPLMRAAAVNCDWEAALWVSPLANFCGSAGLRTAIALDAFLGSKMTLGMHIGGAARDSVGNCFPILLPHFTITRNIMATLSGTLRARPAPY